MKPVGRLLVVWLRAWADTIEVLSARPVRPEPVRPGLPAPSARHKLVYSCQGRQHAVNGHAAT